MTPPQSGDLANAIHLHGSRGETLHFLLFQTSPSKCIHPQLTFQSAPGAMLGAVRFFELMEYQPKERSFPGSPTTPIVDAAIERKTFCNTKWILGEIDIPRAQSVGQLKGTLVLDDTQSLGVTLQVWKMTLPESPTLPLYTELTPWYLLLGHYGKWHAGEIDLSLAYLKLLSEHRIYPLRNYLKGLTPENGTVSFTHRSSAEARDSWEDAILKPSAPEALLTLPFPFPPPSIPEQKSYFSALGAALKKQTWSSRSLLYFWDEPAQSEMTPLIAYAKVIKENAPNLKLLTTTLPTRQLETVIDIFSVNWNLFDQLSASTIERLQMTGKQVWAYGSCMSHGCDALIDTGTPDFIIDRPAAFIRAQAWLAIQYGLKGLLYYSSVYAYQFFPKGRDLWNNLFDFSGHGDGTLFYPGRPGLFGLVKHQPVASVRMKIWRQASFDAEYLVLLKKALSTKKDQLAFQSLFKKIHSIAKTPKQFNTIESSYDLMRIEIGNFLNSL